MKRTSVIICLVQQLACSSDYESIQVIIKHDSLEKQPLIARQRVFLSERQLFIFNRFKLIKLV